MTLMARHGAMVLFDDRRGDSRVPSVEILSESRRRINRRDQPPPLRGRTRSYMCAPVTSAAAWAALWNMDQDDNKCRDDQTNGKWAESTEREQCPRAGRLRRHCNDQLQQLSFKSAVNNQASSSSINIR